MKRIFEKELPISKNNGYTIKDLENEFPKILAEYEKLIDIVLLSYKIEIFLFGEKNYVMTRDVKNGEPLNYGFGDVVYVDGNPDYKFWQTYTDELYKIVDRGKIKITNRD